MKTESLPSFGLPFHRRDRGLVRLGLALVLLGAASLGAAGSRGTPIPVSPGGDGEILGTATSCPTFSWGGVADAQTYELAVFELDSSTEDPILRAELPGTALGWTPSSDQCLEPGLYLWSIRLTGDSESEWPRGRSFEVRAAPSDEDVAQAIETLERYRASANTGPADRPSRARTIPSAETTGRRLNQSARRSVMPAVSEGTGVAAAITGEQTAASGEAYGVVGTSASPLGAGLFAANSAPDAYDLVLDGSSDGAADTHLSQSGLDIPSASPQQFSMGNSGGGTFTLEVSGTVEGEFIGGGAGLTGVPVGAHLHAGADIASGTVGEPRIAAAIARDAEVFNLVTAGDGAGSGLDADLLDGLQGSAYATAAHLHAGDEINSGTVADARIASTLARDSEVFGLVTASDGAGSGLDADLLDGLSAGALQTTGAFRHYTGAQVPIETVFPTFTQVSSVPLAAGNWIVIVNTGLSLSNVLIGSLSHRSSVYCQLKIGGATTEFRATSPPDLSGTFGYPTGYQTHVTLLGTRALAAPALAVVECAVGDADGDSVAIVGTWVAIKVDTLQGL